jgi:hypothetical protein
MGSPAQFQVDRARGYKEYKKTVTGTYTARTGRPSDDWVFDNPIDIDDPSANFTLTIPSGYYMGQTLLVVMSSNDDSKTCTISVTNHETSDPEEFTANAVDEYLLIMWTGTEWVTIANTVTT